MKIAPGSFFVRQKACHFLRKSFFLSEILLSLPMTLLE